MALDAAAHPARTFAPPTTDRVLTDRSSAELQAEAALLSRYLVGRAPTSVLADRYVAANHVLFRDSRSPRDVAVMAFVGRQPWSLPSLDSASALFRPHSLLRKKVLTMAAILEASPEGAVDFLPRSMSPLRLVVTLVAVGFGAAVKALVGTALLHLAERARPR